MRLCRRRHALIWALKEKCFERVTEFSMSRRLAWRPRFSFMMRGAAGIEDPWMCSREHRVLISCLFESGSSSPSSWDQVRIAFDQI